MSSVKEVKKNERERERKRERERGGRGGGGERGDFLRVLERQKSNAKRMDVYH